MSFWKFLGNMALFSAIYKFLNRHRGGHVNPGGGGNNGCGGLCYDPESMRLQSEISDIQSRLNRMDRHARRSGNSRDNYAAGFHDDCGYHDDCDDCDCYDGIDCNNGYNCHDDCYDSYDNLDNGDGYDGYDDCGGYDDCDRDW